MEETVKPYLAGYAIGMIVSGLLALAALHQTETHPVTVTPLSITTSSWFDDSRWGCASNDFEQGTVLRVEHVGRVILVPVLGRGPKAWQHGVTIDLTRPAFAALGNLDDGHISVTISPNEK